MKKVVVLCLAILVCFMMAACGGSSGTESVGLNGAVLKGYDDIAFESLLARVCEKLSQGEVEGGGVDPVDYRITYGWDTDKFEEGDLPYGQTAVTCTITTTIQFGEDGLIKITYDFYMSLQESEHVLTVVGSRYYATDGEQEMESFTHGNEAREKLEDFLDVAYR